MNSATVTTRSRLLAVAGQLLALTMIVIPALGVALASSTPGPGGLVERARTFGFVVDSSLMPLAGVFLAIVVASAFGQRRTQWTYTALAGLLGLFFLALLPLYGLDVLQLRPSIRAEFRELYHWNLLRNLLALTAYAAITSTLAVGSFRSLRRVGKVESDSSELVGSSATAVRKEPDTPASIRP